MLENNFEILFNWKYNIVYFSIAFITLFFVLEFYFKNKAHTKLQYLFLYILGFILVFLFGTRGEFVGTDTSNNIKYFTDRVKVDSIKELNDIGLYSLSILLKRVSNNIDFFLSTTAFLFIFPLILSIKNLKLKNPLLFFFCLFSMFFFKGMGINIQKQGLAFSFFLLGVTTILIRKRILGSLFFVIAFLFHASILIPISVFFFSFKVKKINWIYIVYFSFTFLSIVNFNLYGMLANIPIVNLFVEDRLDTYYIDRGNYKIGFRPEFWIFNTIFAVLGFYTLKNIKRFNSNFLINNYKTFYIAYLLLSSFFFLMFSASFSDRFGIMSWVLIPFLLIPYIQANKRNMLLNTLFVFCLNLVLYIAFNFI